MGTVLHKRYGIEVCETTLQRIMSRRGLTARIRQVRKAKPSAGKATRQQLPDNLLNREFQADRPMYRLVTDVTYVPYFENDEWHLGYLSLVQDLFNRAIVAWVYSKKQDVRLGLATLQFLSGRGLAPGRLLNHSILEMDGAVGDGSKALIMSYDDESLTELVSEVEEELVKLSLVLGIETS